MIAAAHHDLMVVDVCGTLVRDDTTIGLIAHHLSKNPNKRIRRVVFALTAARLSPFRMGFALLERISGRHLLKHFVVRLLAGDTTDALSLSASSYAALLLSDRRVKSVWSKLNAHQRLNGRVILASASLGFIVKYLADAIDADFVASELEAVNGVLTGRYLIDLTGCKESGIEAKYGNCLADREFSMISDNVTDRPFMEKAGVAYVVLHKESHRARWSGFNATFLDLNR